MLGNKVCQYMKLAPCGFPHKMCIQKIIMTDTSQFEKLKPMSQLALS